LAWFAAGLTYVVVMQQVAVVNLTFQADNRTTGLRLICLGQFVLVWAGVLIAMYYLTGSAGMWIHEGLIYIGGGLSLFHWTVWGLFFVTERDELSQRVVRNLPQSAAVRCLVAPLYPGGNRGLVFTLLNIGVLYAITHGLMEAFGNVDAIATLPVFLVMCLYALIALNFSALVARWGMDWSESFSPIHARVVAIVLVAIGQTLPMFMLLFDQSGAYQRFSLLYTLNIFLTVEQMDRNTDHHFAILATLGLAATLLSMANLPAMLGGIREMIASRPLPKEHVAPDLT
jgi:hypothetical protein